MERKKDCVINNAFYDFLEENWYMANNHPVALLRQENRIRNPWIAQTIKEEMQKSPSRILDVGCGGGFLSNFLAAHGHEVWGIDLSFSSLEIAKKNDSTKTVHYLMGDAQKLPYPEEHFDVVCAMDLLEHVEKPYRVIRESSRVLRKGGLFFFHTFNRTFWSWFLVIKGVEWRIANAPRDMHVYPLFLKPSELTNMCSHSFLEVEKIRGLRPNFFCKGFWKTLFSGYVEKDFAFTFTSSLKTGYVGFARKKAYRESS